MRKIDISAIESSKIEEISGLKNIFYAYYSVHIKLGNDPLRFIYRILPTSAVATALHVFNLTGHNL